MTRDGTGEGHHRGTDLVVGTDDTRREEKEIPRSFGSASGVWETRGKS